MTQDIEARSFRATLFVCALIASVVALLSVGAGVANSEERPAGLRFEQAESIPTLRSEVLRAVHRRIVIEDHHLTPKEIILDYGEPFGWLSHSRAASRIVFEREVARSMMCRSLVNFSIKEDELKSSEMQVNDVANFCQLEPGRYPYRIIRTDPSSGASRRLEGAVIVLPAGESAGRRELARRSVK